MFEAGFMGCLRAGKSTEKYGYLSRSREAGGPAGAGVGVAAAPEAPPEETFFVGVGVGDGVADAVTS